MLIKFFVCTSLSLLLITHVVADETLSREIKSTLSVHDEMLKIIEEERLRQEKAKQHLLDLERRLNDGEVSLTAATAEASKARASAQAQRELIDEQQARMDELVVKYDLYRRQNNAKWIFPILAGLYAANNYADNTVGDQALWGLAGFGAVMAWEQTGYGPGRVVGSGIHYIYTHKWEW